MERGSSLWWLLIGFIIGFAGLSIWKMAYPSPGVVQEVLQSRPAERQADDSLVAATELPKEKSEPPPHLLPKGSKEERRGHVTVKAKPEAPAGEPLVIDYSLVRQQDGGRRMVFSSSNGQVLDAVDIPIEAATLPPEPRRWSAGVAYQPGGGYGAVVARDVGPVRLGGMVLKPTGKRAEVWLSVGYAW
ncbi:hypothetical protein [Chitinimonas naiadis]